ncbi:MAG: nucleoside triphosphate pyrophosphohydrolase [Bacteroidales bacterium]|nr:nucleoside triphosphate pyrophosphohydrolase [Bacteroidales bacterium]MDD3152069.1 nucleoside triphosphate pyrophosphohydrolase [Bacteroidales bacterium]MDD3914956.1 nucleoside triphosphate pyrophosphohydrolase [Bacteroidales bacterium]MDD4634810.1 nucleoside triphosphate pyrophosphohydrolase [Bacteroidales bacterium]
MKKDAVSLFKELLEIMDKLRTNCPWDKKQTFDTLRYLTIEETYELSDAIIEKQFQEIKKELGDVLLHIVFYSKLGSENKGDDYFDISDVIENINDKLIKRHPHIFGDVKVQTDEDVKNNWEKIKLTEAGRTSVLSGVPKSLPAVIKAYRIQEKARGIGFDWDYVSQVWDKVQEEIDELHEEVVANDNKENMEMEFGDLMFALINYARFIGVNPEDALEKSNRKFIRRFQEVEKRVKAKDMFLPDMSLKEMDKIWDEVKADEK